MRDLDKIKIICETFKGLQSHFACANTCPFGNCLDGRTNYFCELFFLTSSADVKAIGTVLDDMYFEVSE